MPLFGLCKSKQLFFVIWISMLLGRRLEKEMATHSSVLAWRIPWTEKPGRLQSMGRTESDTTEATQQQQQQEEGKQRCACIHIGKKGLVIVMLIIFSSQPLTDVYWPCINHLFRISTLPFMFLSLMKLTTFRRTQINLTSQNKNKETEALGGCIVSIELVVEK